MGSYKLSGLKLKTIASGQLAADVARAAWRTAVSARDHYRQPMPSKEQRLRTTADGFMAGLVACGFRGPWRYRNLDWEGAFLNVWDDWQPQELHPDRFPYFEFGGGPGRTSQPRDMLWQLKRTSPFHRYNTQPLPQEPDGLTPQEFLDIRVGAAQPEEWIALADAFLAEVKAR